MILETITAAALGTTGIVGTSGASDEARLVANRLAGDRYRLRESYVLGGAGNDSLRNLCDTVDECGLPNWDGYGAAPVAEETFIYACHFLRTMPLGMPAPDVGVEADGDVTLEWHRSAYRTISVSVSPDADLHYSALIGPDKHYGTVAFLGDIPKVILDLIRTIYT